MGALKQRPDGGRQPPSQASWLAALHLWTAWALAAAPLIDTLRRYPEFLIVHDVGAGGVARLLGVTLVLVPAAWLGVAALARFRVSAVALLLLPPLILVGLALGIGWGVDGEVGGEANGGLGAVILALVVAGGAAWAYYRLPWVRRFWTVLAVVALVSPVLLLSDRSIRQLWLPQAQVDLAEAGLAGAPLVVVVLDELPVTTLLDEQGQLDSRRFPNLAKLAASAHWFDNVESVDSSTPKAVSALLAGTRLQPRQLPISRDLPVNLFTLLASTYRITALEPVTRLCPSELNTLGELSSRRHSLWADLAVVALHLVVPEPWSAGLPAIDDQWGNFGASSGPELETSEPAGDLNWQGIFALAAGATREDRVDHFERWLAAIDDRERGALYFAHLLLPHRPWIYFPSGTTYLPRGYREPTVFRDKAWPRSPSYAAQALQRHLLQAEFVDQLIGRLVARLLDQGIYDRAVIAVTADHGIALTPGTMKRRVNETNRAAILQVPLLLKLPGQEIGIRHRERRSTLDLLPTLLEVLGKEPPDRLLGRSLLAPADSLPDGRASEPADLESADLRRQAALARRTEIFGPLRGRNALFALGPARDWIGRGVDLAGLPSDDRWQIELEGPGLRLANPPSRGPVPPWIYGRITGASADRRAALAIVVDGTIQATGTFDPEVDDGGFRILLPEQVVAGDAHELAVLVFDPATGTPVLPATERENRR